MAVNFGRLGTVTFGNMASIICTPESQITSSGGGGGGGGVTPSPTPNWADINYLDNSGTFTYASQQIQGITSTITLSVTFPTATYGVLDLYYLVTSSPPFTNGEVSFSDPQANGFSTITTGDTFSVTNNQYVLFGTLWISPPPPGTTTVTVKNITDGNTTLDTFTATGSS